MSTKKITRDSNLSQPIKVSNEDPDFRIKTAKRD